ncbi:MAG: hypothetical protein HY704_10980 [Gemmatimonadetes bacterium]|nr:hypothetical protein [Gemmatimonadota bacterium]
MASAREAAEAPAPHPIVEAAARGILPAWAEVTLERRGHIVRVVTLLNAWARAAGVALAERTRWLAAGWLHDALRDAPADRLRPWLPEPRTDWPPQLLHGPAAAGRLGAEGVRDEELLTAVAYHTLGHEGFGTLGKALYAADFLEPGRRFRSRWRAELRRRMPAEIERVTEEILAARLVNLIERRSTIHRETLAFWNAMVRHGRP